MYLAGRPWYSGSSAVTASLLMEKGASCGRFGDAWKYPGFINVIWSKAFSDFRDVAIKLIIYIQRVKFMSKLCQYQSLYHLAVVLHREIPALWCAKIDPLSAAYLQDAFPYKSGLQMLSWLHIFFMSSLTSATVSMLPASKTKSGARTRLDPSLD